MGTINSSTNFITVLIIIIIVTHHCCLILILGITRSVAELAEAIPLTANQLTAKTWENLVRRSCPFFTLSPDLWTGDSGRLWDLDIEEWVEARLAEEEVNVSLLAKILSKMEDRQTSLLVLLHVIAERFVPVIYAPEDEDYPMAFYLRCPCKKTHAVNHLGFLLLEKVEGSLESAEQEVVKVSLGEGVLKEPWLSALASRLVRQRSSVAQIEAARFRSWAEGGLDNLLFLQQRIVESESDFSRKRLNGNVWK